MPSFPGDTRTPRPWLLLGAGVFLGLIFAGEIRAESLPDRRPALIGPGPRSLVNLIDTAGLFRKGQRDAWVMFECLVAPDGVTWPSEFFTFSPDSKLLEKEVLKRLRHAKFIPAVYNRRRTYAYFAGTVTFVVLNGQPRLRVFASQELDEIRRGADFIAPQPVAIPGKGWDVEWPNYPSAAYHGRTGGRVVIRHSVDATGKTTNVQVVNESPAGHKFGEIAEKMARKLDYLPAYRNGQPADATYTTFFHFGRPKKS